MTTALFLAILPILIILVGFLGTWLGSRIFFNHGIEDKCTECRINTSESPNYNYYRSFRIKYIELPTLNFDKFVSFYNINPEDWYYNYDDEKHIVYKTSCGYKIYKHAFRIPNYFEYLSYKRFFKRINKEKAKRKQEAEAREAENLANEHLKRLLESVNKDIDKILTAKIKAEEACRIETERVRKEFKL